MKIDSRRRKVVSGMVAAPLAFSASRVLAQTDTPLTIVLTVPAGSSLDALARMLAERMRVALNRTVIVESRPGAGGLVAIQYLKKQKADGSFLLMAPNSSISLLPLFTSKPTFELEELYPVVDCTSAPMAITVNTASGLETLQEYFESVRKDPVQGSIGVPSATSLMAPLVFQLGRELKLPLQTVAYRGGAPLLADLLGNQIPASGSIIPDYLEHHRAGKLKILAVASQSRSVLAPDIPTFAEAGVPGYDAITFFSMYARAGVPEKLATQYAEIVTEALHSEEIKGTLHRMGLVPEGGTSAELLQKIRANRERWAPVIKEAGIRMDG